MRINNAGNVGIGTSSPAAKLHLLGSGSTGVRIDETATARFAEITFGITKSAMVIGSQGGSPWPIVFETNSTERLRITGAGNVGIGTSAPAARLVIDDATTTQNGVSIVKASSMGFSALSVTHQTSVDNRTIADFNNIAGTVMLIRGDGNVGIGTSSPASKMQISGSGVQELLITNSDVGSLSLRHAVTIATLGTVDNIPLKFETNSAERLRITSTGDVGIGTSSPAADLHIAKTTNVNDGPRIRLHNTSTTIATNETAGALEFYASDASAGGTGISGFIKNAFSNAGVASYLSFGTRTSGDATERLRIDSAGNVGIGESAPDYKLDVNGTFGFTPGASVTPADNGDVVFELTNNTTLTVKAKGSDGVVRSGTILLV
jgi:hypothetical protein